MIMADDGYITGVELIPDENATEDEPTEEVEDSGAIIKIDMKDWHEGLGHVSNIVCKKTAKHFGIELRGKLKKKCRNCLIGKAKQKKLNKLTLHHRCRQ